MTTKTYRNVSKDPYQAYIKIQNISDPVVQCKEFLEFIFKMTRYKLMYRTCINENFSKHDTRYISLIKRKPNYLDILDIVITYPIINDNWY